MTANDNQVFECDGPQGSFVVEKHACGFGLGGHEYRIFKLIAPHTSYNRKPTWKRDFVDKFFTRERATEAARDHAGMSLKYGQWFAAAEKPAESI